MENKKDSSTQSTIDEVPLRENPVERSESDLNFQRKNQVNWREGLYNVICMLQTFRARVGRALSILVIRILILPFSLALYIAYTNSVLEFAIVVLTLAFMGFLIYLIV